MAEAAAYKFDFKELAEILVKKQDIHEGHWCISVKFGIHAANMALNSPNPLPTAIVPIIEIGIQKMSEPSPLTVDAAKINPAPRGEKRKK